VSEGSPLRALIRGIKSDGASSAYLVTVVPARDKEDVKIDSEELPGGFFEEQTEGNIKGVHFCSKTRQFLV
jgi:hypothetical protein